ncbi:MAG: pre-peptidase C-terminal domain-containing protein [Anaerolineaceae bacterium]|nr:pre-peptidase C-terminal domain-containing protein [Anaerolineaceae bacterium]
MIDQQQSTETDLLNPYVGPRSFSSEQFHLFKGRTSETDELMHLLLARRLVLFYAQSGAGKTSLLNAGLIPALKEAKDGFEILPVGRVGDSVELPEQVNNIFVFNLLVSLGVSQNNKMLANLKLNEFLLDLACDGKNFFHISENPHYLSPPDSTGGQEGEEFAPVKPRVLIIDQFEEIFTVHPEFEEQRKDFFQQISEALAADPYLYILLSMRGDYYNRMTPYVHLLPDSLRSRYNMEPMRETAALQAVMEPAKQLGRPFTLKVAHKLITYLRRVQTDQQGINSDGVILGPYVETVQLQVVCFQLWNRLRDVPGNNITLDDVNEVARRLYAELSQQKNTNEDVQEDPLATIIKTALSSYYEQAVFQILHEPTVKGIDEYQLRRWFSEELITDGGMRNLLPRGELDTKGIPETAVTLLDKKHHLIRDDMRGGRQFIELVHDSFVEPILSANQRWNENRYRSFPWLEDAKRYHENADPALLLRGNRLHTALKQAETMVGLPEDVQLFLRASKVAEEERERQQALKEQQREEEKRQQELAHERALAEEHRKRAEEAEAAKKKQSTLTTVAVIFSVLAVVGGLLAFGQRQEAVKAQSTAESVAATAVIIQTTAVANATTASSEAYKAQEAEATAVAAQNVANQQKQIADALRLAAQAKEYLNSGETTSALLLSIEALASLSKENLNSEETTSPLLLSVETLTSLSEANDQAASLAHDIAQGMLLEALYTPYDIAIGEDRAAFRQELRLPEGITTTAVLYQGPVSNSLAAIQDNSIIYWQIDDLVTQTIELPADFPTPIISTINQDGSKLALANGTAIAVYPLSADRIGAPEKSLTSNLEKGVIQPSSKITFNADSSMLAVTTCTEREVTSTGSPDNEEEKPATPEPAQEQSTPESQPESSCFIHIYNLAESAPQPKGCPLPLPSVTTAIAFLPHGNQLIWSGQRNGANPSQLYRLDFADCTPQSVQLPSSHQINSVSVFGGTAGSLLITAGDGLQFWRISEGSLHPIGNVLPTSTLISTINIIPAQSTLIARSHQSVAYAYDINVSDWPSAACRLAERNLTVAEWEKAFPASRLTTYEETCVEFNFGIHISLALDKLDEAKMEIQNCKIASASSKFSSAYELAMASQVQDLWNNDFNNWAREELIAQYLQGNLSPSCTDVEFEAALRSLSNEPVSPEVLINIADMVRDGQTLFNLGLDEQAIAEYEVAFQQIAEQLPETLHPLFNRTIVKDYSNACVYAFANNYEVACERLIELAAPISAGTSNFSTVETQQIWRFEANTGSIFSVKITAETDNLDPLLLVFNEEGELLDSDSGPHSASSQPLFARESENYLILATGTDTFSGAYQLTIEEETSTEITFEQVEIASTANQTFWVFNGQAGDVISISMNAIGDSLDPYLTLLNEQGNAIMENDDVGDSLNSLIDNFLLPESGNYYVQTTGRGNSVGSYELTLTKESPHEITIGQIERASTEDVQLWAFEANAGDVIDISMNAVEDSLDPYLTLYDTNGEWLIDNDDSEESLNSLISNFQIPETGTYFIKATDLGNGSGIYELRLELDIVASALTQIKAGGVIEGLTNLEDNDAFAQNGTLMAEDYNRICWFGSLWGFVAEVLFACDTAVSLEPDHGGIADSRGVARALTDDLEGAIEDFQQFIEWDLAYAEDTALRREWIEVLEAGENPFFVNGVVNETLLSYLRGDTQLLIPQNVGEITVGDSLIASTQNASVWSVVLDEPTTVAISMIAQDELSLDPLLYLFDESGNELFVDDDGGTGRNSFITITLEPGTYYLRAGAYSGSGEYELTVQVTDE